VDRKGGRERHPNPFSAEDPGQYLGAKQNRVWKPLICAVHGMCAGGAFYWLNEADIIICSEEATFFDPHTTYGMVSALEPVGLARRIPLGEVMRIALFGLDERMSSARALGIGLVS
jgi:enoyl-CoA hydratase/carnithine racemase